MAQDPETAAAETTPSLFLGKAWFWLPIAPLIVFDLWSKAAVFSFLATEYPRRGTYGREHVIWNGDALSLRLVSWRNTGTIWGLGQDWTNALIGLRCLALVLIVYFAWRLPRRARVHQLVLGMILAGAVGNLYDNFTQNGGGVRDFLLFKGWLVFGTFPAFNVADSCICVGACTLALLLWRGDAAPAERQPVRSHSS
jgi:lipoprotein signal peptidase